MFSVTGFRNITTTETIDEKLLKLFLKYNLESIKAKVTPEKERNSRLVLTFKTEDDVNNLVREHLELFKS